MAQNVSYANNFAVLEALLTATLPTFGKDGEGILNNNFLFAALKQKKMFNVQEGGLEIWHSLIDAESSNSKWQSHTGVMSANLQDPSARLRYQWKTYTSSVVINKLHDAMNKGRAMLKNWSNRLRKQAELTIPNQFNSAFWAGTPGINEPNSLPSLFPDSATTGNIGGIARSTGLPFQHLVDSDTVTDIGSEAGLKALKSNIVKTSVGSGGRDSVDIVIMADDNYAALQAFLDTQKRFRVNDALAKLSFDTIQLGKTTISFENASRNFGDAVNTIGEDELYGINSNHLNFEALKDGNFIWDPEGFKQVGQTLNRALYFWVFCNLTVDLPRAFFKMTDVNNT